VRCFLSGKYVVVRLADNDYHKQYTDTNITNKLRTNGFHLVESMASRAARTIMAFRVGPSVLTHPAQVIKEEIATRNDVSVEEIIILRSLKFPALKIRLTNSAEADKLIHKGVRAFSVIIPAYNLEKEKYQPVNQCFKCYQFDHSTSQCPKSTKICSKCAIEGHTHIT